MTTPAEFVAAAATHIGYVEGRNNWNKFAPLAGHAQNAAWCATFVVAVARSVGLKLPSESAYTPTMFAGFQKARMNTMFAEPGSLAFFDFPGDSKHRIQHVGIVATRPDTLGRFQCIEGNTSSGSAGSQDNGGGVYLRTRQVAHAVGFGRPNFAASVAQPSKEPTVAEHPIHRVNAPASGIAISPSGKGYMIVCADGGVFSFGDAPPYMGRVEYVLPAGDSWSPDAD